MKLEDVHIVILSSIKWDFLWQRHQILANYLAKITDVTYIETTGLRNPTIIKSAERLLRGISYNKKRNNKKHHLKNLNIFPPIVAPPTFKIFRIINQHIFTPTLASKIMTYSNKPILFITYLPTSTALFLMEEFNPVLTVYDCVLNFERFPGIPKDIVRTENELINRSDLLVVDSTHLFLKHQDKKTIIEQIPSAVDFDHFYQAYRDNQSSSENLKATYFGGIDNYRIDWAIIEDLLQEGITVELIGPAPDGIPIKHDRLIYKKPIPHDELPEALRDSDALILPYKITEFTKSTYPAKLFECFATGKPIIATPLPDLLSFSHLIEIADNPSLFTRKVTLAVEQDHEQKRKSRVVLAKENSWTARCNTYKEILGQVLFDVTLN